MRIPSVIVTLALSLCCGCGGGEVADTNTEPPITGQALYRLSPGLCLGDGCRSYTLYRDADDVLELRAYTTRGEFVGRSQADLRPDTAAQLDVLTEALATAITNGEIAPNTTCPIFHDAAHIELIVLDTTLDYDMWCEPEGAEQIDMLLYAMLDDLERCRASQRLSPKIGCESLSPDWGE